MSEGKLMNSYFYIFLFNMYVVNLWYKNVILIVNIMICQVFIVI